MPTVISTAETLVAISKADFLQLVTANMADLLPANTELHAPSQGRDDGRVFEIVFPVDAAFLDKILRAVIPGLPPLGSYTTHAAQPTDPNVGYVRWTS